jgi:hypothetical protein
MTGQALLKGLWLQNNLTSKILNFRGTVFFGPPCSLTLIEQLLDGALIEEK